MPALSESYPDLRDALTARYGRPSASARPEPPGGAFGRLARALLERSVPARALEALLASLADAGLLDPAALAESDPSELARAADPAGPKALAPLRRLARWVVDRGGMDVLAETPTEALRDELRALRGVGPGAADALLLHGLDRPAYPLDRPTYRVLVRHGWLDTSADYDEARDLVERLAPDDPRALADLAGWMDRLGPEFCRPSVAKCDRCPLRPFLPRGGPINPAE